MTRHEPVTLAGTAYTQADAWRRCQAIFQSVPAGDPVTDTADLEFLHELLLRHPDYDMKVGPGVAGFVVRVNRGSRGVWVVRVDGTTTDVSLRKCLTGTCRRSEALAALRDAVHGQTAAARTAAFTVGPVSCPITGEPLEADGCHVDHAPPWTFLNIAQAFAREQGGWDRIGTVSADGMIGRRLQHDDQREAWRRFHADRAQLRVVSVRANLSILARRDAERP